MSLTRFHVQNNALSPPPQMPALRASASEPALLLRRFFFPEILSTGGFTLDSGENVFQQLYRSRPRGAEKDFGFALECMRMPSHPPHTMVNRAKRGLLSSLIPSAHRLLQSGAGLSPKAVAGIQPDAIIALLNGKNSSLRYYTNNIFKISPLNGLIQPLTSSQGTGITPQCPQ